VDWLPVQNAVAAILAAQANARLSLSLAGSGRYAVATLEAKTDPSNPMLSMMICMSFERSQVLWDCEAGQWVGEIKSQQAITAATFHVGQSHIAAVLPGSTRVALFPIPQRGERVDFNKPLLSLEQDARSIVFSSSDEYVVIAADPEIENGKVTKNETVAAYALPSGKRLFECTRRSPDSTSETTDPRPSGLRRLVAAFLPAHSASGAPDPKPWYTKLAISPQNELFGITVVEADRHVCLLRDIATGGGIGKPIAAESKVMSVDVLPERGLVAWVREPAILEVWQLPAHRQVLQVELPDLPLQLSFDPDGHYLLARTATGKKVRVYGLVKAKSENDTARSQAATSLGSPQHTDVAKWQSIFGKMEGATIVAMLTKLDTASNQEFQNIQEIVLNSARKLERDVGTGADIPFLGLSLLEFCDGIERYPDRPINRSVLQQIRDLAMKALPEQVDPAVEREFRQAFEQHVRKSPSSPGVQQPQHGAKEAGPLVSTQNVGGASSAISSESSNQRPCGSKGTGVASKNCTGYATGADGLCDECRKIQNAWRKFIGPI
jgi:hypothetical protein